MTRKQEVEEEINNNWVVCLCNGIAHVLEMSLVV